MTRRNVVLDYYNGKKVDLRGFVFVYYFVKITEKIMILCEQNVNENTARPIREKNIFLKISTYEVLLCSRRFMKNVCMYPLKIET